MPVGYRILVSIFGAFAFTNAVQGWFIIKNKWYEVPLYLVACLVLFFPAIVTKIFHLDHSTRYYMYALGLLIYACAYLIQKTRIKIGKRGRGRESSPGNV